MKQIQGVWIANHPHSQVLASLENTKQAIKYLKEKEFNTIFPVIWNRGYTLYPSAVMQSYDFPKIDPFYDKQNRDPIAEIITEAHQNDIKVIPWFEYGFAASHLISGGHLLKQNPDWKAINSQGERVTHGGLTWMNGFHPQVQQFMLELVLEVVKKYDVDGIQGCDRFPAAPIQSGYDTYTVSKYQREFNHAPPKNDRDPQWIQWRANLLTEFLANLYQQVKAVKPNILLSLAPAVYPFCLQNLLQDSKAWVNKGLVDIIHPQIYRSDFFRYRHEVNQIKKYFNSSDLAKFAPGIALKANNKYVSKQDLQKYLKLNQKTGFCGQVIFHYEELRSSSNDKN
ncbi:conserved hypothetical protein [Hyella patelloides LEGE 07179]|uniref:Glycosyl hydrolase-like 10 domain-containing protein n=1 Tax=Hyella patelloides LEGE 07179 TaxID=945734 RepID=A0A563VT07_9CYAN|nr:family 10 glycosylhydrolase [Hyella patelloides]VEP14602.1 conserved hypothetical protein [Hyella patelloides LEGE 07179]